MAPALHNRRHCYILPLPQWPRVRVQSRVSTIRISPSNLTARSTLQSSVELYSTNPSLIKAVRMCYTIVDQLVCPDCGTSSETTRDIICPSACHCPQRNRRPLPEYEEIKSKICTKCRNHDCCDSNPSLASEQHGRSGSHTWGKSSRVQLMNTDYTEASRSRPKNRPSRSRSVRSDLSDATTFTQATGDRFRKIGQSFVQAVKESAGRRSSTASTIAPRSRDDTACRNEYSSTSRRRSNLDPSNSRSSNTGRSSYLGSTKSRQLIPLDDLLRRHGLRTRDLVCTYADAHKEYEILRLPQELEEVFPRGDLYKDEAGELYWEVF